MPFGLTVAQRCGPVREHAIVKGVELLGTIQSNGRNLVGFGKQQLISHVDLTPSEKSSVDNRHAPGGSVKGLLPVTGEHYSVLVALDPCRQHDDNLPTQMQRIMSSDAFTMHRVDLA